MLVVWGKAFKRAEYCLKGREDFDVSKFYLYVFAEVEIRDLVGFMMVS